MNDLLVLFLSLIVAAGQSHLASAEHLSFRVFEAVDCGTSGTASMQLQGTTERYCFERKTIVDETQIASAEVRDLRDGHKPSLLVRFRPEAAARLREATTRLFNKTLNSPEDHPGRVGLVIDGKLVSVGKVYSVVDTEMVITNTFADQECHRLAEQLSTQAAHLHKE